MSQGQQHRKRHGGEKAPDKKPELDPRALEQEEDLELLQDSAELNQEQAQRLQPQLGNQAVQSMMNRTSGTGLGASMNLEIEEEQEEQIEQEEELDHDLDLPEHGGSSGGGGGDPWNLDALFGGIDDDDDNPLVQHQKRLRRMRRLAAADARQESEDTDQDDDALDADLDAVDAAVPGTSAGAQRTGDEVHAAVEAALASPRRLARRQLRAEALVDQTGPMDPLGRPAEIGRFLVEADAHVRTPMARALGRLLAAPAAALMPEAGGFSGAAARLAALAVCAQAAEAGGEQTDRAVALGLSWEAWPAAVGAARDLAPKLHAPEIADRALAATGGSTGRAEARGMPRPLPLGGVALGRVIPPGFVPEIPAIVRNERPPPPAESEDVAAVDAVLAQFTGGLDPSEPPEPPSLSWQSLEPFLDAASALVNAMGRCQVELAAAGVAVRWVRADAPIQQVLSHGDAALRRLARDVVNTGEALERVEGEPLHHLGTQPADAVETLRQARASLQSLRTWAFDALAGAIALPPERRADPVQVRP